MASGAAQLSPVIEDTTGALGETEAPAGHVAAPALSQTDAARQGRLSLVESSAGSEASPPVPVQWDPGRAGLAIWIMPPGSPGARRFAWRTNNAPLPSLMQAVQHPVTGQIELGEAGRPVLGYLYRTVEPGEVLARVSAGNRIYARPRSDYLHPLYGPAGEVLTRDWSIDHPHHRGIYWAWPEVDYGNERGDLHALQRVFARPTGRLALQSGPVFAQVEAENLWQWEDREPIVREWALLRAYRATKGGRVVDLAFRFVALKEGITLARRGQTAYGGLNLRLQTPASQSIVVHTDPPTATPRRVWSDLSGVFAAGAGPAGLTVFQHQGNPEYPGDWVQYPELSWCQPTFPTSGVRYPLRPGQPLILRYRLWVHSGVTPDEPLAARRWDALHAAAAPPAEFTLDHPLAR